MAPELGQLQEVVPSLLHVAQGQVDDISVGQAGLSDFHGQGKPLPAGRYCLSGYWRHVPGAWGGGRETQSGPALERGYPHHG